MTKERFYQATTFTLFAVIVALLVLFGIWAFQLSDVPIIDDAPSVEVIFKGSATGTPATSTPAAPLIEVE